MRHSDKRGKRGCILRRSGNGARANTGLRATNERVIMKEDWIESFRASLMECTLRHRGEDTNVNRVAMFVQNVERECSRVCNKPDLTDADKEQVRRLAYAAIDRAQAAGRVLAYSPER